MPYSEKNNMSSETDLKIREIFKSIGKDWNMHFTYSQKDNSQLYDKKI